VLRRYARDPWLWAMLAGWVLALAWPWLLGLAEREPASASAEQGWAEPAQA